MNYYRRYSGDYLRDTARLNLTEHGAYTLLMDYYYTEEKPLPLDQEELFLMVRAMRPIDRSAVEKVLGLYFTKQADGYHQKRIDHEIGVSRKARDNGSRGGRPSTEPVTGSVTGLQTGKETGSGGGSGHPPTTNLQPPAANLQTTSQPAKAAGRGARLSADWKPDAEQIDFCKAERPDLDPQVTGSRFRDYWIAQPGSKGRKADWSATWRNWVRNEKRINGARSTVADANRAAADEAIRRRREREEQASG